jgi:hypothetical protein
MYELNEWQIQDDSRVNSLINGLGNSLQMELDKDVQLRIDNVHKALERHHRG